MLNEMKKRYISPIVTVAPFSVEEGYGASVGNSSTIHDAMLFNFFEIDDNGSAFGNDRFNNIADENSNYNFFGD